MNNQKPPLRNPTKPPIRAIPRTDELLECENCGGSGDVHNIIGEWMGVCTCECGDAIRASMGEQMEDKTVLSDAQIEKGRESIFSTDNPYCPCDRKTMLKAARWAEQAVLQSPEIQQRSWQPIETAPKHGRVMIFLLTPSRFPQVAWSNTWWTAGFSVENKPTHWMLVPEIPVDAAMEVKP